MPGLGRRDSRTISNPPVGKPEYDTNFRHQRFDEMVKLIGCYHTTLTSQMVKLMHEIERLQRMRTAPRRRMGEAAWRKAREHFSCEQGRAQLRRILGLDAAGVNHDGPSKGTSDDRRP